MYIRIAQNFTVGIDNSYCTFPLSVYTWIYTHGTNMCVHNVVSLTMKHLPHINTQFAVHTNSFEMFVADSLVENDCIYFVLTFETPPSSIGLEHVCIRYSCFEVHTQMCTFMCTCSSGLGTCLYFHLVCHS